MVQDAEQAENVLAEVSGLKRGAKLTELILNMYQLILEIIEWIMDPVHC